MLRPSTSRPRPAQPTLAPEPSASGWLRSNTRAEHESVEAGLDAAGLRGLADLAGLLRGWEAVWQAVGGAVCAPGACPRAREELRVAAGQALVWLRRDLADLGCAGGALGVATPGGCGAPLAGRLAEPPGSWGVAYVLRGSRLGGAVLAPRARAALALPPDCGTRFFVSAGTKPGREWVAFRRRLDSAGMSPAELAAAVEAARWTFRWVGAVTAVGRRAEVMTTT